MMEEIKIRLIKEQPFYGILLSQFNLRYTKSVPTAGVGFDKQNRICLFVNKDFFEPLSFEHKVGVLLHEVLHVAYQHITRGKELNQQIANIAMDIEINQHIGKSRLPNGALFPDQFGFPENKSFEYYYLELLKNAKKAEGKKTLDDHSKFGEGQENQDGLAKEIAETLIENAVRQAARAAEQRDPGKLPHHIQELLNRYASKNKVNWKELLRRFVGRNLSHITESTRTRANRRLGLKAQGQKKDYTPKVLIGIDESRSVSNEMSEAFFSEVRKILDGLSDKTEVAHFDTQISSIEKLDSAKKFSNERRASGGTDFQCMIDYAKKVKPDILIIFTDSYADCPEKIRIPVLWTIAGTKQADHLYGTKIYIEGQHERKS